MTSARRVSLLAVRAARVRSCERQAKEVSCGRAIRAQHIVERASFEFELRAWLATGSYLTRRVRAYDPLSDLAQKDVGYGDYIHRQGRPNMPSRAHRYSLQSALITQPPSGCRAWQLQLGGLLDCGYWLSPAPFTRQSGSVHISMWAGLGRPVAGAWQAKCALCRRNVTWPWLDADHLERISTCSVRMSRSNLGADHLEQQEP